MHTSKSTTGEGSGLGAGTGSQGDSDISKSLWRKVDEFEVKADLTSNSEDLAKEGNHEPKAIRECGDRHLGLIDQEKKDLLVEIEANKNKLEEEEDKDNLVERVCIAAELASDTIKESTDVAIDTIDDSSDTEQYIYNNKKNELLPF
jgi:hypothetical protein